MRLSVTPAPPASYEARRRLEALIEPADRTREIEHGTPVTFGDVLDSAPYECRSRSARYRPSDGGFWINSWRCRSRACPMCVVPYLVGRIAPAYGYWSGRASVRGDTRGLVLRGPAATPGVLTISSDDGLVVFAPGDDVRAPDLDVVLRDTIRRTPIELQPRQRRGEPSDTQFSLGSATNAQIRAAADTVGLPLRHVSGDAWAAMEAAPVELIRAFREVLWASRRRAAG